MDLKLIPHQSSSVKLQLEDTHMGALNPEEQIQV